MHKARDGQTVGLLRAHKVTKSPRPAIGKRKTEYRMS